MAPYMEVDPIFISVISSLTMRVYWSRLNQRFTVVSCIVQSHVRKRVFQVLQDTKMTLQMTRSHVVSWNDSAPCLFGNFLLQTTCLILLKWYFFYWKGCLCYCPVKPIEFQCGKDPGWFLWKVWKVDRLISPCMIMFLRITTAQQIETCFGFLHGQIDATMFHPEWK